jgi:ATP-dependent 26S proteasome regulatory subunit
MGLTDNQQRLIRAITENDIQLARKCAIACLTEDTTQKNQWFCKKYKSILESSGANMIELPQDLKGLLCVEDVSNSFKEGRYYLSDREKAIYENIVRMKKVNERLMEMGIPYINSTLLFGESGTGKTTFGRYVAFKTGLPFCYMNFSNLVDSYMGSTSKNISKAFSYAISNPCVFMLDEVDCISIRRSDTNSSGGTGGELARITITLMQEFDKLPNDVIVIGATNRMDRIDEALLRRFSTKHEVKTLTEDEKTSMVEKYLQDIGISLSVNNIETMVSKNKNQSMLLNDLIRAISEKIAEEVA